MTKTPTLAAALETFERSPAPAPDTPDPVLVNRQPGKTRTGSTMQAPQPPGKKRPSSAISIPVSRSSSNSSPSKRGQFPFNPCSVKRSTCSFKRVESP